MTNQQCQPCCAMSPKTVNQNAIALLPSLDMSQIESLYVTAICAFKGHLHAIVVQVLAW